MSTETIIMQLEAIFRRLGVPQGLESPELEELNRDWLAATAALNALSERELKGAVAVNPFLKPRLKLLVERLAEVNVGLLAHKTEIAGQLMAHNRKIQSTRRGYGGSVGNLSLLRQQA